MSNRSTVAPSLPRLWRLVPFESCLSDKQPSVGRLQQKDYLSSGVFAIIDQGRAQIAGYSDRQDLVYKGDLPVVIFGDHTRLFKFVDLPFICGADGVKVLVPNRDIVDPLYFFYCSQTLPIPSRGYSRHFQFLRETYIPVPPISEQQRIADVLHRADGLRRLRREANQRARDLLPALFYEMFGDPFLNPKGWAEKTLDTCLAEIRYGTGSPPPYAERGRPFIRATEISKGTIDTSGIKFISEESARDIAKCCVRAGNIILVRSGAYTGDCAMIPVELDGAYAAYDLILTVDEEHVQPEVVEFLLLSEYGQAQIRRVKIRSGQPHLNAQDTAELKFAIPPLELQCAYVEAYRAVKGILVPQFDKATEIHGELFESLLARAFMSELTAPWRSAHLDQLAKEAAERDQRLGARAKSPLSREDILLAPDSRDLLAAETTLAKALDGVAQQIAGSTQLLSSTLQTLAHSPVMTMVQELQLQYAEMFDSLTLAGRPADRRRSAADTRLNNRTSSSDDGGDSARDGRPPAHPGASCAIRRDSQAGAGRTRSQPSPLPSPAQSEPRAARPVSGSANHRGLPSTGGDGRGERTAS